MNKLHAELAQAIVSLAKQEGLRSGEHLPEEFLADKFAVSRAPIRYALKILVDHGILRKEPYRGHFLVDDADRLDPADINSEEDSTDRLYITIAEARLREILPEAFGEAECMRLFDVSRHALRKALYQLSQDGIIARDPARGWRFTTPINDEASYDASFRFRIANEPAALLEPTFRAQAQRIEDCRRRHREILDSGDGKLDLHKVFQVNAEFHEMLADFSRNPFFLQAIRQQNRLIYLIEWLAERRADTNQQRLIESCKEHLQILDAVEAEDSERAAILMKEHLVLARRWKIRLALS